MEGIVQRMESNQWLTKEQEAYTKRDSQYSDEQEKLAERLNSP